MPAASGPVLLHGYACSLLALPLVITAFSGELAASEQFGLPAEAKEAAAFALLAWQTWHRLPGNVAAATGAARPMILGSVTYA